ncbi:ribonuclease II [Humibacillus sp. DSM 29435]|uniref:RNB domain-containing ribonuclease n=1 Tax=Humibacillus sp. DSM 29435 TaxID=1869167 RepID=UPI00087292AE|nr:RNB domain-containing ribonuclease [Humibacillus sp. DSM 29435]OFE15531.1 ribonuclease II [Humibacillus sp. DSM 29435]
MARRSITYRAPSSDKDLGSELTARFAAIREEFKIAPEFPPSVIEEAKDAADRADLPDRDESAVPFVTIDPASSQDLDQAMFLERDGDGYRVRYAIADVPAFVAVGGAIDQEARKRGQTVYCPDLRVQLHPTELSEGAASLLPGQVRPAFVWDIALDADAKATTVDIYRAMVRSVRRYDYVEVQRVVDDGSGDAGLLLLKEIGEKRIALEQQRGGASLPMPEQEVDQDEQGGYEVSFRPLVAAEDWNAQISLLAGMGAADLMLKGKVGILRTMPPPEQRGLDRFRHQVAAAGVSWPKGMRYGELLHTLNGENPKHLALIHEATALFRGAGYTPFDGEVPEQPLHAAVAAPYAHVTAPLRRLVDRFGLVVCEALAAGREVPGWVREALPTLPEIMTSSDRIANGVDRACTDAVEAAELLAFVGSEQAAVVVDSNEKGVVVQLTEIGVVAKAKGVAKPGESVRVRVVAAEIATGTISLLLLP